MAMDTKRLAEAMLEPTLKHGNMMVFVTNDRGTLTPVESAEVVIMRDEMDVAILVLKTERT